MNNNKERMTKRKEYQKKKGWIGYDFKDNFNA